MDRPVSQSKQRTRSLKGIIRIVLIIAAVVAGFFLLRTLLATKKDKSEFRIAQVSRGDIENAISAYGQVVPAFEEQINAPVSTEIKNVVIRSGTEVQEGNLLMELDQEFIQLQYEQLKDQVELRKNKITLLKYEYEKNLNELKYNDEIKALELSSLKAQLKDTERLQEIGSATIEEIEQAKLKLQIAELEKKKLENQVNFREQSIEGDRRNLELELLIEEKKLRELQRKFNETEVRAPRPGVVTWINESIGQKVNEGEALVRLANLKSFRVEASCSDRYTNVVKPGMPVKVRVNKVDLIGYISSVLPTVENNTIEFLVALEAPDHQSLRPNMRVEVFIISDKKQDVLRVANGSAFSGAVEQNIFVLRGEKAIKESVRVGLVSMDYVEILSNNIQEGDRIIISDMEKYDHLETITLND